MRELYSDRQILLVDGKSRALKLLPLIYTNDGYQQRHVILYLGAMGITNTYVNLLDPFVALESRESAGKGYVNG